MKSLGFEKRQKKKKDINIIKDTKTIFRLIKAKYMTLQLKM